MLGKWEKRLYSALIASMVGLVLYWTIDRTPPVNQIYNIITEDVHPGGDIILRSRVFRHRSCQTHIDRVVIDGGGFRYILQDLDFNTAPGVVGEQDEYSSRIPLPLDAASGIATLKMFMTWRCNIIHVIWPIPDYVEVKFIIMPKP
jgi:hypothetical protein